MKSKLTNMIKRSYITLPDKDDKDYSTAQVGYFGRTSYIQTIYPYGMSANAPANTLDLQFNIMGQEENLAAIPYCAKERFRGLKIGEVIFGSPVTKSYIKFLEDKSIYIHSLKDVDFTSTIGKNKFNNIELISATASRLLATDGSKDLVSSGLINWVHSTSLTVADDGVGGVNINLSGTYEPAITPGTSSEYWRGDKTWQTLNTLAVTENTNLYYTDARSRAAISSSATGLTYTSATGVFSLTTNYVIPTTTEESNWNSAYSATNNATALNISSTIVKRTSAGRTAVSLQDDDAIPKLSLDHNNRLLADYYGRTTIDWNNRQQFGIDDQLIPVSRLQIDYQNSQLFSWYKYAISFHPLVWGWQEFLSLDWKQCQLWDTGTQISINWDSHFANFLSGVTSIDYGSGLLYDTSTAISIDWVNRTLNDNIGDVLIDWQNELIYFNASGLNNVFLNWDVGYIFDKVGNNIVGLFQGQLIDNMTNNLSLEWNSRYLDDFVGNLSIAWGDRYSVDSGGELAHDWQNRELADHSGIASIYYDARTLHNGSDDEVFCWSSGISFFAVTPVARQTGGAASAGATYTSTEQGMINAMYTALRNYGLLT
jgi:hypothetical protein